MTKRNTEMGITPEKGILTTTLSGWLRENYHIKAMLDAPSEFRYAQNCGSDFNEPRTSSWQYDVSCEIDAAVRNVLKTAPSRTSVGVACYVLSTGTRTLSANAIYLNYFQWDSSWKTRLWVDKEHRSDHHGNYIAEGIATWKTGGQSGVYQDLWGNTGSANCFGAVSFWLR